NLPLPPPGFRGLDPDRPVTVYRRNLPHLRQDGATYFVTFRLADSLPQSKLQYLRRLRAEGERTHPPPRSEEDWQERTREITGRAEAWLDEGHGACSLREPRWADELRDRLHHFQGERYLLSCWAIMPNHCHLAIRPNEGQDLEELLGAMKAIV